VKANVNVRIKIDTKAVIDRVREGGDEALGSLANETSEIAKDMAPVLTGNLRSSIAALHDGPMKYRVVTQTGNGTNGGYGAWQELGTAKMPAHPYLVPGLQAACRGIKGNWV
jgi:hypothetical protein